MRPRKTLRRESEPVINGETSAWANRHCCMKACDSTQALSIAVQVLANRLCSVPLSNTSTIGFQKAKDYSFDCALILQFSYIHLCCRQPLLSVNSFRPPDHDYKAKRRSKRSIHLESLEGIWPSRTSLRALGATNHEHGRAKSSALHHG